MEVETFKGGIIYSIISIGCVIAIGLIIYYSIGGVLWNHV